MSCGGASLLGPHGKHRLPVKHPHLRQATVPKLKGGRGGVANVTNLGEGGGVANVTNLRGGEGGCKFDQKTSAIYALLSFWTDHSKSEGGHIEKNAHTAHTLYTHAAHTL